MGAVNFVGTQIITSVILLLAGTTNEVVGLDHLIIFRYIAHVSQLYMPNHFTNCITKPYPSLPFTSPEKKKTKTMEPPMWAIYAAVLLVTTTLLLLSNHLHRRGPNLPPGPKPWPIIGNFNLIGPLAHWSLGELSKKYGPIMMLRFASIPVVVASSVEMARLFLTTHDVAFAGRFKTIAGKYTTYNYSDLTFCQYGPYWRQGRKLCSTELLNPKRIDLCEYIRVEELKSMLRGIFELRGKPILVKDYVKSFSLNVISRMVVGEWYLDKEASLIMTHDEFKKMIDELFFLNGAFNVGDWIPWVRFLDLQGYEKRLKVMAKKFDRFLEYVLDKHNERRENEQENWVAKDIMDVLLNFADGPNLEVEFGRTGVKAFTLDLFAGGIENSSVIVEWAMTELLKNPHIITKATKELDQVVGKERLVQEKDIHNLPYIRAIVKETLRLHPPIPMLSPRMSREDVQVNGYDVPKGCLILVNASTIQRDPNVYERPEEFWPERFIGGKNIDVKGQDFELLPFGSGRRMCVGYNLALKVIESSLANLIHGFSWKLPDNMKPEDLDMEESSRLSNPKSIPLVGFVEPRLPHHLFRM